MRLVRGFIQRLEGGALGSVQARLGEDVRSLSDGTATAVLGVAGPSAARILGAGPAGGGGGAGRGAAGSNGGGGRGRVRLVLGQPPVRPNQERLSLAYWATAWVLGRDAASILPIEALSGGAIRAPWGWQATALESLARLGRARDRARRARRVPRRRGRRGGPRRGGTGRRRGRVPPRPGATRGRRRGRDRHASSSFRLAPSRHRARGPGPTSRSTRSRVGRATPTSCPGQGLFVGPERFDRRPFSPADAARTVADVAVETIKARGEPARYERLLGEILVGLDRAGQLRRLLAAEAAESTSRTTTRQRPTRRGPVRPDRPPAPAHERRRAQEQPTPPRARADDGHAARSDP